MFEDLFDKGFVRFNAVENKIDRDFILKWLSVDREKISKILEIKNKIENKNDEDKARIRVFKRLILAIDVINEDLDKLIVFPDIKMREKYKSIAEQFKYICDVMEELHDAVEKLSKYQGFIPKDKSTNDQLTKYDDLKRDLQKGMMDFNHLCKTLFLSELRAQVSNVHKVLESDLSLAPPLAEKQLLVKKAKEKLDEIKASFDISKNDHLTAAFLTHFNGRLSAIQSLEEAYAAEAIEVKKSQEIFDAYVAKRDKFNKEYNPLEENVYTKIKQLTAFIESIELERLAFRDLYKEKTNPTMFDQEFVSYQRKLKQARALAEKQQSAIIHKIENYLKNYQPFAVRNTLPDKSQFEFFQIKTLLEELSKEKQITLKLLTDYCQKIENCAPGWNIKELFISLEEAICKKTETSEPENKKAAVLYQAILALFEHGEQLANIKDANTPKVPLYGTVTCNLAADINRKAHEFFDHPENLKDKKKIDCFKSEFEKLLNCKNDVMKIHRREWMKKISDIGKALLLTFSLLGIVWYKSKTGKWPFTLFKEHLTKRQSHVQTVGEEANRLLVLR